MIAFLSGGFEYQILNADMDTQRLSLNGTVKSHDLVNVTITIPTTWGNELVNSTVTGLGFVNVRFTFSL